MEHVRERFGPKGELELCRNEDLVSYPTDRLQLAGREVVVTEVFWDYWYLAAERQQMFRRRLLGQDHPWTTDPILADHRFTNAYRASDRVSQYLLQRVVYNDVYDGADTVFRVLLFKIFNRIATWEHLVARVGQPTIETFKLDQYEEVLGRRFRAGERLYSGAYIMPSPQLGQSRKHANHLTLLDDLLHCGTIDGLLDAVSLEDLYQQLLEVPSFGPFLAFQYAIDLNYSAHFDFDEMDFVVAGPGALRGIAKCFTESGGLTAPEIIRAMSETSPTFFAEAEIEFNDLWGRQLQLVDCQNLFCEVDKYARVAHPGIGVGGPTRIKQNYVTNLEPLTLGYPPKWDLPWSADAPTTFVAADLALTATAD